jgi:hypothetical protein
MIYPSFTGWLSSVSCGRLIEPLFGSGTKQRIALHEFTSPASLRHRASQDRHEPRHEGHPRLEEVNTAMNTTAAYGFYPQDIVLTDIVSNLNQAGFENESICMMLPPGHPIASMVRDASLFNAEKEASAVTAGLIGWLSELGAVLIPTVGFFIRSQAFFHALMVAREVPALCGNAKTLVGLGFSETEAERFEDQLGNLGALVYVSCTEGAKTLWAREVLRHTGAQEAATLEQSTQEERLSAAAMA